MQLCPVSDPALAWASVWAVVVVTLTGGRFVLADTPAGTLTPPDRAGHPGHPVMHPGHLPPPGGLLELQTPPSPLPTPSPPVPYPMP